MNLCQACFTVLGRFEKLKLLDNSIMKKSVQLLVQATVLFIVSGSVDEIFKQMRMFIDLVLLAFSDIPFS